MTAETPYYWHYKAASKTEIQHKAVILVSLNL